MRFLPESIRGRVILFGAAIAVPLAGALVWGFVEEANRQHAQARDLALQIARSLAGVMNDSNIRARALMSRLEDRPKVQFMRDGDCDSLFAIVDFFPQYPDLLLYDTDGRVVCSGPVANADLKYASAAEPQIARAIRAGAVRSDMPMLIPVLDRWMLIAFEAVNPGGKPIGYLTLMQYFNLNVDAYPPGTIITIRDLQHRIIARSSDARQWVGKTGKGTIPAIEEREGRFQSVGIDGVERQYGFKRVASLPWRVFVGIPSSAAMATARNFLIHGAVIGGVVLLLIAILAIGLARTIERPLAVLARTVKRAAAPGTTEQVPIEGPREVQVVAHAFNEMVRSRSDAEAALVQSTSQLEALSEKLLEVQEEERTRIAREIHDELGQLLTALNMDIGGLLATTDFDVEQRTMVRRIRQALSETLSSVQRISAELRPAILDDFGLVAAIELEIEKFEQRTGIECAIDAPPSLGVSSDAEPAIFRIVQEAMTNVARHSNAKRMEIRIHEHADELVVEICDDGRGIMEKEIKDRSSIGLIGMRERARRIGAKLDVAGLDGLGTTVSLRMPLVRPARAAHG